MDIRDLLQARSSDKHQQGQSAKGDEQAPSQGRSDTATQGPIQPLLPSSLPASTNLPSPAPTTVSFTEGYYRRPSAPPYVKNEDGEMTYLTYHNASQQDHSNQQSVRSASWAAGPGSLVVPPYNVSPVKRPLESEDRTSKRQKKGKGANQKWDAEEDARVIELRGAGMKWVDISKAMPGRTDIACRLHYQNYLEKRGQWDEESKTKLARIYERMKPDLWQPLARELGVPWRSAEAMHWMLGEREMARRANTSPFTLLSSANGTPALSHEHLTHTAAAQESTIFYEPRGVSTLNTPSHPSSTTRYLDDWHSDPGYQRRGSDPVISKPDPEIQRPHRYSNDIALSRRSLGNPFHAEQSHGQRSYRLPSLADLSVPPANPIPRDSHGYETPLPFTRSQGSEPRERSSTRGQTEVVYAGAGIHSWGATEQVTPGSHPTAARNQNSASPKEASHHSTPHEHTA